MAGSVNVCPPNECLAAVGAGELVSMQDVHGRMNRRVEKGGGGGGKEEGEKSAARASSFKIRSISAHHHPQTVLSYSAAHAHFEGFC